MNCGLFYRIYFIDGSDFISVIIARFFSSSRRTCGVSFDFCGKIANGVIVVSIFFIGGSMILAYGLPGLAAPG